MPICTGSDGGGSIRIPSAYSGLFGFKVSFGRVGDDRQLRQRAHVGARADVPVGARRGPLRRRDRRPDRRRPHVVAEAARPYEDAVALGRRGRRSCAACAPRGRRRSASRCAIPRSRSSRTKPRSRSCADAGIELVDVDFHLPQPGPGVEHPVEHRRRREPPRGVRAAATKTSRRCRGPGFEAIERHRRSEQLLRALRRRWRAARARSPTCSTRST